VTFFSQLHRSIFDPSLYQEILHFKGAHVFGYMVRIILLTSFLTGVFNTYYFVNAKWGVPARIEAAFKGMEIRNGILDPKKPTPYFPPSYLIVPLFNNIISSPHFFDAIPDSFIVIDTGKQIWTPGHEPFLVMRSNHIEVHPNVKSTFKFPYTMILGKTKNLTFTTNEVRAFLISNIIEIALNSMLWNGVIYSGIIVFSVFFLALAAYIFRLDRGKSWFYHVRLACYASSPISIGTVLVALSGVKLTWTWHVLIFLSTIVMFRAIFVTNTANAGMKRNDG
jgi:hypothetical protein